MVQKLLKFLDDSPVNFISTKTISERLEENGFQRFIDVKKLSEISSGSKFYFTKNDSSVYAFRMGRSLLCEAGFKLICAHCDSPTFRIKPASEMHGEGGVVKLNTEVYGGPILSTWFDRPLSLAGRVIVRGENPLEPVTKLLHIKRPLLVIPNLAIHFNRQVNDGVKLSKQKDMLPIIGAVEEKAPVILPLIASELQVNKGDILDFDLYLYDTTPACTVGLHDEFISSGRLDDLSMVHAGMEALLSAETSDATQVLAIFDNEETGSQTKQGAASPFLSMLLKSLVEKQGGGEADFLQTVEKSFMISADNAHGWHPNYPEKMDPTNHPVLGGGPVIKFNAAQKYASDAVSAAVFSEICAKAGVPCQRFVNHSDVAGGSTLGNILASSLPLRGVDMGAAVWAMHSCRETASCADHRYTFEAFKTFYNL